MEKSAMNRIQNQIRSINEETRAQETLREAMERQSEKEKSGLYKWVSIGKPRKLRLLCRVDKDGNLAPKEVERIKRVRQTLGI